MAEVSVIVPVYNAEKTLSRSVESVLAQTELDWELWLVNDGSSDGSLALCREYEAADPRIHVIDKPNGGVGSARNAGLDAAAAWLREQYEADVPRWTNIPSILDCEPDR